MRGLYLSRYALPLPERAAVAAIAYQYSHFRAGLRKDIPVSLPKVLRDDCDGNIDKDDFLSTFDTEEQAFLAVAICEECFGVTASVCHDVTAWLVIVDETRGNPIDAHRLAMLQGICRMLIDFDIVSASKIKRKNAKESPADQPTWKSRKTDVLSEIQNSLADLSAKLDAMQVGREKTTPPVRRQASAKRRA